MKIKLSFLQLLIFVNLFAQNDGQIDSTFGLNGVSVSNFPHFVQSTSINIDSQNRIITAGSASISNYDFGATRFKVNGDVDSSFATNGNFIYDSGIKDFCNAVLIQPDDKVILGGYSLYDDIINDTYTEFKFIRLKGNGQLDSTFNDSGIVKLRYLNINTGAVTMALQSDGKILAAGNYVDGNSIRFSIIRLLSNGRIDSSFANNGLMIVQLGATALDDRPTCMKIQNDNKILIGGYTYGIPNAGRVFGLVRLNPNGNLDTDFGINGIIKTDISNVPNDYANSLEIQNDGKILLAGSTNNNKLIAVCRYEINGNLDFTFGNSGIDTFNISSGYDVIKGLHIQSDNKIIILGITDNKPFIMRLSWTGNIDTTFNNSGINVVNTSISTGFYAITKQTNNRLLALGNRTDNNQILQFSMVAFNSNLFSGLNRNYADYFEAKIYPNPTCDYIIVKGTNQNSIVSIYDFTGKLKVQHNMGANRKVDVSNLINGIYFLEINNDEQGISNIKFIKQCKD